MTLHRRSILQLAGLAAAAPVDAWAADGPLTDHAPERNKPVEPADVTLRIATGLVQLAPDHVVSTTLYL